MSNYSQVMIMFCDQLSAMCTVQAISNPRLEEHQSKAWQAVLPLVSQLKRYYDFSIALGKWIRRIGYYKCK